MKNLKFEQGEQALLKDEKVTIQVAKKNFSTGQVIYKLTDGREVSEKQLTPLKGSGKKGKQESGEDKGDGKVVNQKLHDEYAKLYEKDVPANMKYNDEWIQSKIDEKKPVDEDQEPTDEEKYNALKELDLDGLVKVIEEKELDIDPDDYEEIEELLEAICEELEIEIPEEE